MTTAQLTSRTTMKALAGLAGLMLGASALAACGSSTPSHSVTLASGTRTAAHPTPAPSNADVGAAPVQVQTAKRTAHSNAAAGGGAAPSSALAGTSSHSSDPVTRGHRVQHARSTPSSSNDDPSNAGVRPVNPCTLVTAPEARSITSGAVVGATEAPLGPTCIYRSSKAKSTNITMTVETLKLSQITQRMAKRSQFVVKSHPAYCGRFGTEMLFVPLTNGQVLNVVAPCSMARQFAAVALGRLAA